MKFFEHIINFEPKIEPNFIYFKMQKKHSLVKIYIPKIVVNGKKRPTIDKGRRWYIYFYFKNDITGENKKFKIYGKKLNKINTIKGRLEYAELLRNSIATRLNSGYVPPSMANNINNFLPKSVKEAVTFAKKEKINVWGESTRNNNNSMIAVFLEWIEDNSLSHSNIRLLTKRHIASFLSYLMTKRNLNNISRNNYRRVLSSIFKELVVNEIIDTNIVENIPKLEEKPNRNKAFTNDELLNIKEWLLVNDPYLHKYLQFITYAFLRPIEVCRIKIGDIDIDNNRIFVRTKTETTSIIRIITHLKAVIDTFNIAEYNKNNYLFTPKLIPSSKVTDREKGRADFFIRRFVIVKKHFNFGKEYGIYSFRHSFALDLYNNFITDGLTDLEAKQKLMTITRHRSLSGLNNYLRNIGAFVPKDYSGNYSIKF